MEEVPLHGALRRGIRPTGHDRRHKSVSLHRLPLREARDDFERAYIVAELKVHDWNMTRTAERLGIERSHLYRKLKAYGIVPPK